MEVLLDTIAAIGLCRNCRPTRLRLRSMILMVWMGFLVKFTQRYQVSEANEVLSAQHLIYPKVTYTLDCNATLHIMMHAIAAADTPILLTGHHFWNLEAYQETQNLDGHLLRIDSSRILGMDGSGIMNGSIIDTRGTLADFREQKSLGETISSTTPDEYCGTSRWHIHFYSRYLTPN